MPARTGAMQLFMHDLASRGGNRDQSTTKSHGARSRRRDFEIRKILTPFGRSRRSPKLLL